MSKFLPFKTEYKITFFKKTHTKNTLTSVLDNIEGLGKNRKRTLLENFESIEDIKHTSVEKLKSLGIPTDVAIRVIEHLNKESNNK